MTHTPDSPSPAASPKLFTFSSGGWVLLLAFFMMLGAAALVLYPVFVNGFHPPVGDGKNLDTYKFDLTNLTIPRELLIASGNPKDKIDAIPEGLVETVTPAEVKMIAANEHIRFLVPSDRVIGVVINGEARAYPLRVLNLHELVNDVVGGVALAVTYAPLCDSVVVFDRRIGAAAGEAREFGVSGLLVNSNSVFFDRRKDGKESLWPQLALRAISGPEAGTPMTLVPYELTTWGEWTGRHPDTRGLLGLRRRKKEYGREPYSTYLATDDVMFPVFPLWNDPKIARKTRIEVMSADGKSWKAAIPGPSSTAPAPMAASSSASPPHRLHAFLFAWYAQHPTDTDYSRILR